MAAGSAVLRLAGAAGTMAVCGASGLAVTLDTHPSGAPLRPAVSDPAPSPQAVPPDDLAIPAGGTCAQPAGSARGARTAIPPLPASLRAAAASYRAAATQQQRQQVLAQLTPDERMQLTAYLQQVARARRPAGGAGGGLSCRGAAPADGAASPAPAAIGPEVVAGAPGAPVSVSAVS